MATAKEKKHQEFINQYFLCNLNQTEAYLKVYPKSSYDSARANSARLIAEDNISAEINRRLKEKQMSADEVLARLGDMASASHADFAGVNLREDLKDHPKAHLVKTIVSDVYEDKLGKIHHKLRLELYDAQAALVHLGRHYKLFTDSIKVDDWRTEIIELFKQGKITKEDVLNEFADEPGLAEGLFESIGIRAIEVSEAQTQSAETTGG